MTQNKLTNTLSPYLHQHQENPVNWYPWSDEAFELAKKENKPIFLSIGYATCHWCHVMAHESFEDEEVAALLNDGFINIKVDREERPDIDQLYMTVCQLLTGSGGWPLTVVMTPEKRPFFAGTYFPKQTYKSKIGMLDLLPRLLEVWTTDQESLIKTSNQILVNLVQETVQEEGPGFTTETSETIFQELDKSYDTNYFFV